ncbi:MAG: hypothetical protein K0R65_2406 [Crocinitomicaceae bacterium]|jgi:hypothetical protein|nr:hypothetical protein [Crocinitomicaceae bacterium]
MRKYLVLGLLSTLLLSCDGTYVTKSVLDSQIFEFIHAGQKQKVLFELKEIRTFTRRNGIFRPGPVQRNVSYGYAFYASISSPDGLTEIYEYPCEKTFDIDAAVAELQLKHSKDRSHYALGYKGETVAIFHSFKKVGFLAEYPLDEDGFSHGDFKKLDLDKLESPREALKKHISGERKLMVTDKQLYTMLSKLPPTDELNYELSFSIGNEDMFVEKTYQEAIINYCKKDKNWKASALHTIKNKKTGLSNDQFISKLHLIGGMEEVVKEDEFQYKLFRSTGDASYFKERLDNTEIIFPQKIKKKLLEDMNNKLTKPCALTEADCRNMENTFDFAKKLGIDDPFELFFKNYEKATCLKASLHELNDEFLFPSCILGESDKRQWIDFVVKNFGAIDKFDRSWAFRRLEEHMTCEQKRALLLKYKKDVDSFGNLEIPVCQ